MQFDAKNKRDNAPLEKVTLSHFNKICSGITIINMFPNLNTCKFFFRADIVLSVPLCLSSEFFGNDRFFFKPSFFFFKDGNLLFF